MKNKTLILLALSLLVAGSAFAANTGSVTNACAMGPDNGGTACAGGNCGFQLDFDGSANAVKVVDDTPNDEGIYRAQFWLNLETLTANDGQLFVIARGTELSNFASAFQILAVNKNGAYRFFTRAVTNTLNPAAPRFSDRITINAGEFANDLLFQIEFTSAETCGVAGGEAQLTLLDASPGPVADVGKVVNTENVFGSKINNCLLNVDDAHMGMVAVGGVTGGTMCFDEFASFRTLAP